MTDSIHPSAQHGFATAAKLYQQARPNYPQDIVTWLKYELDLNEESRLLDLGAGTGKFIPYLKQVSEHITAVEPISAMLSELARLYPEVHSLQASSQNIPLEKQSVDAILCAQSFHWFADFNSLKEIHRILKPQGHLGLIWNQRDISIHWVKALADLIAPYEGDTPRYHNFDWQNVLQDQSYFKKQSLQTFQQQHVGTVEQVVSDRLLSTSFIAAMPEQQKIELKMEFEKIIQQFTGLTAQDEIAFPYTTYAYHYISI